MGTESGQYTAAGLRSVPPITIPSERKKRLSESLWDIDYASVFPLVVSEDGITVDAVGADEALAFAGEHYGAIFGDPSGSQFWTGDSTKTRERYLRHACDVFVFKDAGRTVGLFVGNPVDWSTYYIRSTAFLEEYQGKALYQRFLAELFALLARSGVSRVEAETAPSNNQCVAALMRQKFVVSGSVLSERWGALTRFTRYLNPEAEWTFLRQFCASGIIHQEKDQRHRSDASLVLNKKGVTQ